jgi:UrcA family protein
MDNRKLACLVAAAFLSITLTAGASGAFAGPHDIVVKGARIDPVLQRTVSYRDLNLAERVGQRTLKGRIYHTANSLCFDLNGSDDGNCTQDAIHSTDDQVAQAISRAQRQVAGLAVGPAVAIGMVIGVH